jgi:hypothetical protein
VSDFEYKLLPWPNLTPWLGVAAVALVLSATWEARRSGNRFLFVFWLVVSPPAIFALLRWHQPVPVFVVTGPPVPLALVALLGMLVYLSLRAYARRTAPVPWYKVAVLWTLRAGALAPAFVLLTRPVVSWTENSERRGLLVWLFDVSGSMYDAADLTDGQGKPLTRAEAVEAVLERHRGDMAALPAAADEAGQSRLRVFRFALTARELDRGSDDARRIYRNYPGAEHERRALPAGSAVLLGNGTAIADALERVVRAFPQELFTGVVLVSDGADNSSNKRPEEVAAVLARLGVGGARLYTVTVGSPTADKPERYILAGELKAPPAAPLNTAVPVSCEFTFRGFGGKPAYIRLLVDDQPVGDEVRVVVPASESEHRRVVRTVWNADRDGTHVIALAVRVPADPPPADPSREEPDRVREPHSALRHALIRVERSELRVLFIDRLRPEARFAAEALARAGDLAVHRVTVAGRPEDDALLPEDLAAWLRYDIVVVGDVPLSTFSRRRQTDLAPAVREHGRGLLTIGGWRAFGAGGWVYEEFTEKDNPLPSLLPIRCRRNEGHLEGVVRFVPTRDGLRDGPLGLAGESGEPLQEPAQLANWARLDPLDGANRWTWVPPGRPAAGRFNAVRPGSTVLAVAAGGAGEDYVLLAGARRGRGRVLALAADTTWKWVLRGGDEEAARASREIHHRFWRQMVRWLHVPRPDVRFYMEQDTYFVSQLLTRRPRVHAVLQNLTAEQAARVRMEVRVFRVFEPGKTEQLARFPLQPAGETYAAELAGEFAPGRYEVRLAVEGMPGGEEGRHEPPPLTFRVEDRDIEKMNVGARPDRMEEWARLADERPADAGGGRGRSFQLEEFPRLLETLQRESVQEKRTVVRVKDLLAPAGDGRTPWGAWILFAAATTLLMVEWVLRKAWGLV